MQGTRQENLNLLVQHLKDLRLKGVEHVSLSPSTDNLLQRFKESLCTKSFRNVTFPAPDIVLPESDNKAFLLSVLQAQLLSNQFLQSLSCSITLGTGSLLSPILVVLNEPSSLTQILKTTLSELLLIDNTRIIYQIPWDRVTAEPSLTGELQFSEHILKLSLRICSASVILSNCTSTHLNPNVIKINPQDEKDVKIKLLTAKKAAKLV